MHDGWILLLAFPIGAAVGIAVTQLGLRAGLPVWSILLIVTVVLLGMARAIGYWRSW